MKKQMTLLTIFIILLSTVSGIAGEIKVIFATDATWPPMEFINKDKEIVGFSIDYMKKAGQLAGYTPVFKNVAWDGIFAGLAVGKYDAVCSSVSITDKRKKAMAFSVPYFRVRQALVVKKNVNVKSLADLVGKKVGSQISTTGTFAVKAAKGVISKTYDEVGLAMEDLYNGRIAGVVCDDPVAAQYALNNEKYKKSMKIAVVMESNEVEYYGIAIKKGNTKIINLVNKGIQAVRDRGFEAKLIKKWIGK